ncbi:MAG: hypothetical protein M9894_18080 [Planctomycetes bacterium]|nr:hypothetical protein [Planctomycetota bacterium]
MRTSSHPPSAACLPLPPDELGERLDEARRIDAQLAEVVRRERTATRERAYLLAHVERRELHRALGFSSVGQYAVARGYVESHGAARDLVGLVKRLEALPRLRAAFQQGEVEWTKLKTVARVATAEDEADWLERARAHPNRVLEALVREALGEPAPVRRSFDQTREQAAWLDEALRLARERTGRALTDAEALEIVCRGYAEGPPEGSRRSPACRLVIHKCECGAPAALQGRDGPVPLSPATEAALACEAEVHDLRRGTGEVTEAIPQRIRRLVHDRDRGTCKVPGCGRQGRLHVHHEPGREVTGHDPDRMCLLCDNHHPGRHQGYLEIRGDARIGFRFFLADGTELLASSRAGRADATTGAQGERIGRSSDGGSAAQAEQTDEEAARLAVRALEKLECSRTEARDLVRRARARLEARGEVRTVEALTREALLATGAAPTAPTCARPSTTTRAPSGGARSRREVRGRGRSRAMEFV